MFSNNLTQVTHLVKDVAMFLRYLACYLMFPHSFRLSFLLSLHFFSMTETSKIIFTAN